MAEPGGGEGLGAAWVPSPLRLYDYDNPESVRFRKYATGAHLALQAGGVETGQTPGEVVWRRGKARLYRYEPEKPKEHPVPILMVYALILRPYVLDLVPGNSLVEYLVGEGFDVYLLDWGVPDREDTGLSLDDYVLDYMPEAVERVLATSGAEGYTLFGYCQGGTMDVVYAARSPGAPPKNLVLLAAPVDFAPEDLGAFGLWTLLSRNSEGYFEPELLVGPSGNRPTVEVEAVSPEELEREAARLRPDVLVCHDDASRGAREGVRHRVEILYSDGLDARVVANGWEESVEDNGVERMLSVVDAAGKKRTTSSSPS